MYRNVVLGFRAAVKLQNFMGGALLFLYNRGVQYRRPDTWPSYGAQEVHREFYTWHTRLGTAYLAGGARGPSSLDGHVTFR